MKITAGELAALVHGTLEGDPNTIITHPSKIEEAVDGSLCYLDNLQYEPYLYQTKASAVLVNSGFQAKSPVKPVMIRVENVRLTVSELFKKFQDFTENSGIDPKAEIHSSVVLGEMVSVGAFTNISESAQIGAKTYIHPQVFIGKNVQIGESVIIYPGVRIYKDCIIGNRCIIHSNAVIGSDGFGFAPDANGVYQKIAQLGNVVLGNDVEIGSNTTIDRGTMGSTKIGDGCKLDNLIQIAHNVQIGNHTVIAAQAGIAGSAKIGSNCMIGGQVGIAGHLTIADRTMIQAQSGIASSLEQTNGKWYGSPAMEYFAFLRSFAEFKKLPALAKKLKELEDKLKSES
ncbi:MAG: UDP-3-O-(3-hydroxymyristoyl)glucosamine N-acyltransferase [Saprospiraceae bacterium]|nr:UDP-3-O-(3-hydroxymyristoyl)glucosamine N-acyltransferase [Saprospiraceae bacterium]HRG67846.1 UDP-3-O-(3-hydroxymyristoyl)glucosamine N-acyltransferase [Saprospiraceae bacterium]